MRDLRMHRCVARTIAMLILDLIVSEKDFPDFLPRRPATFFPTEFIVFTVLPISCLRTAYTATGTLSPLQRLFDNAVTMK